ncbi:DUF4279 domain-containing protein [Anthocerotibacter panamensis]|uniref:DUF4279 domain-containing protein n=1 Tax=Anthocerotibacter panamensis TaxID=2857077 RepID=UPI001C407AC4|nr:DUF4279 domain-containing protein [Anthocerotibacter panamensis]
MQFQDFLAITLTSKALLPHTVTKALNVMPTETWEMNSLITERGKIRYHHSGWSIKLPSTGSQDLETLGDTLLDMLLPKWDLLEDICKDWEAEISCVLHIGDHPPPVHFSSRFIKAIARLNAEIDIDIYVMDISD